ncbi:MAG: YCF48-related protein, partial [Bacteroidota bacterium]
FRPDGGILAGTGRGAWGGIFRSTDGGATWISIDLGQTFTSIYSLVIRSGTYIFAGTYPAGVLRSTDLGQNWTPQELANSQVLSLGSDSHGSVLCGMNRRGLLRTTNDGASWAPLGLETSATVQCLVTSSSGDIYAGTADGPYRSTDGGLTWIRLPSPVGGTVVWSLAIDSSGNLFAGTSYAIYRSSDSGNQWAQVSTVVGNVRAIAVDRDGIIFAGYTGLGVWRSTDGGDSWSQSSSACIRTLVRSIVIGQHFAFVATSDSGLFRSGDHGQTWLQINTGMSIANTTSIAVAPTEGVYAASFGAGVFHSTDDGNTWQEINAGLTNDYVLSLLVASSGYVFAGTWGGGVFRSTERVVSVPDHTGTLPSFPLLLQNYPNPFNPSTTIQFSLAKSGHVSLKVFNVLGEEVAVLIDEELMAGNHTVSWDASKVASGMYFYRMNAGDYVETRKLLLIK